ncbi:E3 ubiquitin-protein ligase ubr1 [Paramecium bursaria]
MKNNDYQHQYEIFKESLTMFDFHELEDAKSLIFGLTNKIFDQKEMEPLLQSKMVTMCKKVSLPTMFQCLDCFYDKDVVLCQDCFDETLHKNHEIRVLQNSTLLSCGCGNLSKMACEGMCDQHKNHNQVVLDDKDSSLIIALSLIEGVASKPLLGGQINLATSVKSYEIISITEEAENSLLLFTKILSYLSELESFQQVVVDVLLSQIPQELQSIALFRHDHKEDNFYLNHVLKKDVQQICSCSVWKNLLRYFIFVGSDERNLTNFHSIIQNLSRNQQHREFAKIYVEMLPLQFQCFTELVVQKSRFLFFTKDSNDYIELKQQIQLSQIITRELYRLIMSDAYQFQKYFRSAIIKELCNYMSQVEYLMNLKHLPALTISKYTRQASTLIASLPQIRTKQQAQICCEQLLTQEYNYFDLFIQIIASFSAIIINDKSKFHKYSKLQNEVLGLFKSQFSLILNVAGQNKQWFTQKSIKTMVSKQINESRKWEFIGFLDDGDDLMNTHVQSDAIISNILVYFYLLTEPKDSSQFKQLLQQTLDLEEDALEKYFDDFIKRNLEYIVRIKDYNCLDQFKEAITIYLYTFGAKGYVKLMKLIDQRNEKAYEFIIEIYYNDLSLLSCIQYFEQNQEIKCAIRQLLNQMYYFSKYLTFDQVKKNLDNIPKDILLSQLDLNYETYQLSLKGNPSYNAFLEMDEDQLDQAQQTDQFIIFGNQLDIEMKDKEHMTLTRLRKQLIDDIFTGDIILNYVKDQINDQNIEKLIFFLNLIVTASQHYQLEQSTQDIINKITDIICECKIESKKLILFQKKIILQDMNNQQDKNKQLQEHNMNQQDKKLQDKKTNKLNQYKELYQKKQQQVDLNIDQNEVDVKVCDVCRLEFKNQPIMRLKYLQFNNNFQYFEYQDLEYVKYLKTESTCESEIQLTGCQHYFHKHCYPDKFEIVNDLVLKCQVCKRIGNIIIQVHNVNCDILYYYQQFNQIFKQSENIKYHENFRKMDSNYYQIILQIYLNYIRKILEDTNDQEIEEFNQILQNFNTKELKSYFLSIINKYTSSIFQIMQLIVQADFQLNQQIREKLQSNLENQSMVNLFTQLIHKYVEKFVKQCSNILDLQNLVNVGCQQCGQVAFYRCLPCNLNFCGAKGIQQSCYNIHSIICHNSKLCLIQLFSGKGYVVYNGRIRKFPKLLYKNNLGQQYQEDQVTKRDQYLVDRKAISEFLEVQISDRHINYI